MTTSSRRAWLRRGAAAVAGLALGGAARSLRARTAPQDDAATRPPPRVAIDDLRTVSPQADLYHGWPTLCRDAGGKLLLAYSGGREAHVCPFGRVELMESRDGGASWTWPRVILDSAIDDRDAGVLATRRGTILASTFTSNAWEPILSRAESAPAAKDGAWSAAKLERWRAVRARLDAGERRGELGCWLLRSTDGGRTFGSRIDSIVNSPHGPIELSDGRLLYPGKKLWDDDGAIGVSVSDDDGATWRWLAAIPGREGDDPREYHEMHAVEAAPGHVVAHIRNHNRAQSGETLQCESRDGGRTWSAPRAIGVWGLPSHLLRLRDGRLLMSYGHRRAPLGCQARVSADAGATWSAAIVLHGTGISGDLGYPSTIERDDGALVTVWYEVVEAGRPAALRLATWRWI